MDIKALNNDDIEILALTYSVAAQVFEVDPLNSPPEKQKKIRKWMQKTYFDGTNFSSAARSLIDSSRPDSLIIGLAAECSRYIDDRDAERKRLFEKGAADLPDDVRLALAFLFEEFEICENVDICADEVIFTLDETCSYRRKLILHTPQKTEAGKFDALGFQDARISKEDGGYTLSCTAENYEDDTSAPVSIFFDRAETCVDVFPADRGEIMSAPWRTLALISSEILAKAELGQEYLNQDEKALIPLFKELSIPTGLVYGGEPVSDFAILKQYLNKYGLTHMIPLLDKAAAQSRSGSANPALLSRIETKLSDKKCEPLWRELYALAATTQRGYSDKPISSGGGKLSAIRSEIEAELHARGYEGSYPSFRKNGDMKGVHIEENYGQGYLIGMEKNVAYFVECRELTDGGALQIQFMSGTALLKKGEVVEDIYSCCFFDKGRRLFKTFTWDADGELDGSPRSAAEIAAKRAECKKLSRGEREFIGNVPVSLYYIVFSFLLMGGLFAVLMTLAAFLICCIPTAIMFGFGSVPEMVRAVPWWLLFVIAFVGFGGAMSIFEAKARTK